MKRVLLLGLMGVMLGVSAGVIVLLTTGDRNLASASTTVVTMLAIWLKER